MRPYECILRYAPARRSPRNLKGVFMFNKNDIISRKVPHNGHIVLTAFYGDELITRTYIGFKTQAQAEQLFLEYLNSGEAF